MYVYVILVKISEDKNLEKSNKRVNRIYGGNLLLNIGPDGNGNVPPKSIEILLEVGKMLKNVK